MRIALTYNLQRSAAEAQAEFDRAETIHELAGELASLGHDVTPVDACGELTAFVARLRRTAPELVFNLAEGERGDFREAFYPALFEQLGLAHTGSSASALALCLDKALAKRVVAAAGVAVPRGELVRERGQVPALAPPLIVKPNFEGSSKGITQASVVTTRGELPHVVASCLARYPSGALVEELVPGIDVTVGWVHGLGVLAPIAYAYEPTGPHAILDRTLKRAIGRVRPYMPAPAAEAAAAAAARAFAALGIAGYGRADFRVTPGGEVYFLEMNPLPSLADSDLYFASGRPRRDVLAAIVASARPRRRTAERRSSARRAEAVPSGPPRSRREAR